MTELAMLLGCLGVCGSLGQVAFRFFPEVSDVDSFIGGKVRLMDGLNELDL